jgi:hypothetical protein
MKKPMQLMLSALLALAVLPLSLAVANSALPSVCLGDTVNGTVVAVDEASGQVTISDAEGDLCTVTLQPSASDHPIVTLLGRYFSQASSDDLAAALNVTNVWVTCAADGTCARAQAGDPGAMAGRVTAVAANGDGSVKLTIRLVDNGNVVYVTTTDAGWVHNLRAALQTLNVRWDLEDGGDGPEVLDATTQIARLHQDGLGFGVIVKLYAMAEASQAKCDAQAADDNDDAPCGVTVDELVQQFRSGVGLGQLFKQYGKPELLGVGHVRQALGDQNDDDDDEDNDSQTATPVGTAATGAPDGTSLGCGHGASSSHNPNCTPSNNSNNNNGNHGNGNNGNHGNGNNGNGNNGNGNNGNHGHGKP